MHVSEPERCKSSRENFPYGGTLRSFCLVEENENGGIVESKMSVPFGYEIAVHSILGYGCRRRRCRRHRRHRHPQTQSGRSEIFKFYSEPTVARFSVPETVAPAQTNESRIDR